MSNEPKGEGKLVAVYARVSTANQAEEKTIEAQLLEVRKFAAEKGYIIVKEYLDEGWPGDNIKRPQLDELRVDAKKHIWEAVLAYDPDRIARSYFHQEGVRDLLKESGVELLFVTLPPIKDFNDKLFAGMRGLFADYERDKIAERFRLGKLSRIDKGHVLVTEAPYGFTYIPNVGKRGTPEYVVGHFIVNEKEAAVVRMIFRWVAIERMTLRGVVRKLLELGITPRKNKRKVWNTSTLSTLLRNETYIGRAYWGASYAVVPTKPLKEQKYKKIKKTSKRMRPRAEWFLINIPHKIVDEDLFYRTGKQLRDNFAIVGRGKRNDYLLAGAIWCICGRRRAGEGPQKGKHLYYRCTDRVYSFPLPRNCHEKGINARIADEVVWEALRRFMSTPALMQAQIENHVRESRESKVTRGVVNIENTKEEITKRRKREEKYLTAFSEGIIPVDRLKELVSPLKVEIEILEKDLAQAYLVQKESRELMMPEEEEIERFAKEAQETLGTLNLEEKKRIIARTNTRISSSQKQLSVYGEIDLNQTYVKQFTEYRYRRSSQRWQVDAL
ncbi:MAG: recombinase family protein [Patescibacteria group bacterium]